MKLKISLAVTAFYLLFLVGTAPASLISGFIPSDIKVGHVSGTVWNGKLSQVNYRKKPTLQRLNWKFDWLALFGLKVKANLTFDNGRTVLKGVASVAYGLSGPVVSDLNIDMKAAQIVPYLQLPVPVTAQGKINLVIDNATQGAPYCDELDGYLVWQGALVETPMANVDLATAKVDLSCANGDLIASLTQNSDQITTNAKVVLSEGESYQLDGDVMGHKQLDPTILQALSWIGPQKDSGETILTFKGNL